MYRKQITTALLGVAGILLAMTAFLTDLGSELATGILMAIGIILFIWSLVSLILFLRQPAEEIVPRQEESEPEPVAAAGITQLNWLNEKLA